MDNDFSPVANSSCDNCCGSPVLTVHLPPVDVTCDPVSDKTRKARRKAAKDKHADNWVHPECVGEDDKDIIGIWSCTSCRMLPTFVERLLEKTSMLESLVVKLERSNQQLLSLMGEQSQEIRRLREDIATSKRQDGLWGTACYVMYALLKHPVLIPSRFGGNQAPPSPISNK